MPLPIEVQNFDIELQARIPAIQAEQETYFAENNKYKYIPEDNGVSCHEYIGALGVGYIIFGKVSIGDVTWLCANDYGPENRSFPWVEIQPDVRGL